MSECACNKQGKWNTAGTHLDLFLGLSSMLFSGCVRRRLLRISKVRSEHDNNGTLVPSCVLCVGHKNNEGPGGRADNEAGAVRQEDYVRRSLAFVISSQSKKGRRQKQGGQNDDEDDDVSPADIVHRRWIADNGPQSVTLQKPGWRWSSRRPHGQA